MTFKNFLSVLSALIIAVSFSMSVHAAVPDLAAWNECPMYTVLNDGGDSNSAVDCIIIRVNPELESNQLHLLFLVDMTSFEDEANAGVKIKFNSIGTVELYCDGRTEYNQELFFAEMDNVFSDEASMMLGMEITVGIKQGIPDNLILSFNLYDTHGTASNTYSVDITDSYTEEEISEDSDGEIGAEVKTQKVRTTKYKTTKVKTTKVKTTKVRTTKSKADKYDAEADEDDYEYEEIETELQQEVFEDVHIENDKNKLIYVCAAAVVACTIGGCTVGIINSRKKKNDRGDDQ